MDYPIFIFGDIDDLALQFLAYDFQSAPQYANINITIYSCGGSVTAGNAMQAMIITEAEKRGRDKIKGLIIGECASIATIVSTAIPKGNLSIASSAMYMIHAVRVAGDDDVYQTADQLHELANIMDKFNENLANQLAMRCGKPYDYIKNTYFDGADHYLTAAEAVAEGFCDQVVTMEMPLEQPEIENLQLRKFTNKEERLKLVAHLDKKIFNKPKPVLNQMENPQLEIQVNQVGTETESEILSLRNDLKKAQEMIAANNSEYVALSNSFASVERENKELRGQLATVKVSHEQELSDVSVKLDFAKRQLDDVKNEGELTKYLTIKAFALNYAPQDVDTFIKDNLLAIRGNYVKTTEGYNYKEENKVVAVTADQVVEHRMKVIAALLPKNQKVFAQGSGFNPHVSTQSYSQIANNDTNKKQSEILALANTRQIVYGTREFADLCRQNGVSPF